jgi:hypothetical protein
MFTWMTAVASADPLVAVVVIDQEARDQGYAVELEDLVLDDALPIDVAEGEQVRIVDPDGGRHPLDVAPGEAWEVVGPDGEAWMSKLGEDVRTDVLVVRGDEAAIRALASELGARIRVEDGRTLLVGHDVLFAAPWVRSAAVDRVEEVGFVRVHPETAREDDLPTTGRPSAPRRMVASAAPTARTVAPPSVVSTAVVAAAATPKAPAPTVASTVSGSAGREEVVGEEVVSQVPAAASASLDPGPYVGMYFCGDGTPIALDGAGHFASPHGSGEWFVSAPGVVRLQVNGAPLGRVAIEPDRHYCHAVW